MLKISVLEKYICSRRTATEVIGDRKVFKYKCYLKFLRIKKILYTMFISPPKKCTSPLNFTPKFEEKQSLGL